MAWEEWQHDIEGESFTVEQRKSLLRKKLQTVPMLSARRVEEIMNKIIGMETQLGADRYGHVNTSIQMSSTTTTTTTLTPQQRLEAGQLYLQSPEASMHDPQQVHQMYSDITAGRQDYLAKDLLKKLKQIAAPPTQQNVRQQIMAAAQQGTQPEQIPQQSMIYQVASHSAVAPNASISHHQQGLPQYQVQQPTTSNSASRHKRKHSSRHQHQPTFAGAETPTHNAPRPGAGQQQQHNPFDQAHVSCSSTTTTTTTSSSSQNHQQPPQSYGFPQTQQQLPQQQFPAPQTPERSQHTLQGSMYQQPTQQGLVQQPPHRSSRHRDRSPQAALPPAPGPSQQISARDKHKARMAEYEQKYGK